MKECKWLDLTEDGVRACLDAYPAKGLGVLKQEDQYWQLPLAINDKAISHISLKADFFN